MTPASTEQMASASTARSNDHNALVGTALALLAGAMFGGTATILKFAYHEGASTATMILLRADVGALLLWLLTLRSAKDPTKKAGAATWKLVAVGGLLWASQLAFFYSSLSRIPVGVASLLVFAYPALTALLAWPLDGEPITRLRSLALMSTLTGVGLVLSVPTTSLDPFGVILGLLAAVAQAMYVLALRRVTAQGDALRSAAIIVGGAAVSISLGALLFGDVNLAMTSKAWVCAVMISIVMPAGIMTYIRAVRLIGPSSTGIGDSFGPVCAVLLGVAFFHERLSMLQVTGGCLVLLGAMTLPLIHLKVSKTDVDGASYARNGTRGLH